MKDYAFTDELVDVYRLNGQPDEAKKMAEESVDMLADAAKQANEDEQLGHYADRELAYAYLKTSELDKALEHAKIEYERRPDNIDVNETLAWVHYKRGEYAEAAQVHAGGPPHQLPKPRAAVPCRPDTDQDGQNGRRPGPDSKAR